MCQFYGSVFFEHVGCSNTPEERRMSQGASISYHDALKAYNHGFKKKALTILRESQLQDIDSRILYGIVLRSIGRYELAEVLYKRLLAEHPNNHAILLNLSNVLIDVGRPEQAILLLESIPTPSIQIQRTLALSYFYSNAFDKAEALFLDLAGEVPANIDFKWHLALCLLFQGKLLESWEHYEARKYLPEYGQQQFDDKPWTKSEDLSNRKVLIYTEQGYGDNIQFARFLPVLVSVGAQVCVVTRPALTRLFSTIPDIEVVERANQDGFDYVASLLSLPYAFGISPERLRELNPSVFNIELKKSSTDAIKVAIVWSGKMTPKDRSIPLSKLLFLLTYPEIELHSLQIDSKKSELDESMIPPGMIVDHSSSVSNFYDSAMVMKEMDMVISIDSAPLHLAASLGVETIGLLLFHSDWRWLDDKEYSIWYPKTKLIRQESYGDWHGAAKKLEDYIEQRLLGSDSPQ